MTWTPEKIDFAKRIFPRILDEVAAAVHVPANDIKFLWAYGELPPGLDQQYQPETAEQVRDDASGAVTTDTGLPTSPDRAEGTADGHPIPLPEEARPVPLKQRILAVLDEHPDWYATKIAEALDVPLSSVTSTATTSGIELPKIPPEARSQAIKEAAERRGPTLKERIRALHRQHPTWTARLFSKELGAPYTSVSTMLTTVRKEEGTAVAEQTQAKPEFSGRREMLKHYGEVARRLGKV